MDTHMDTQAHKTHAHMDAHIDTQAHKTLTHMDAHKTHTHMGAHIHMLHAALVSFLLRQICGLQARRCQSLA